LSQDIYTLYSDTREAGRFSLYQWRNQGKAGGPPPILQTKHKHTFKVHEIGQFDQFEIIKIVATRSHF